MGKHATYSPSGACKWLNCAGSIAMERGMPNPASKYSDEGTAAHFLASYILEHPDNETRKYLGQSIVITNDEECSWLGKKKPEGTRSVWKIDEDMLNYVMQYVNYVYELCTDDSELYVEVRLPLEKITGELEAEGTSDAVIVTDTHLTVVDLKYGQGIGVSANDNEQLKIYALATLDFLKNSNIDTVSLVVHQPRKENISVWDITVSELEEFREYAKSRAQKAQVIAKITEATKPEEVQYHKEVSTHLNSGDHCKKGFCKARHKCPALGNKVLSALQVPSFEDLDKMDDIPPPGDDVDLLSMKMRNLSLIENWCKAVRAAVEHLLMSGQKVPGYKVVQGKKGNRSWVDENLVIKFLTGKKIGKDYIYNKKLCTPTDLEKTFKAGHIKENIWNGLQEHITQKEGPKSVAPESDKREAIDVSPPAFEDLDQKKQNPLKGLI